MLELKVVTAASDGRNVTLTAKQAEAIETMSNTRKGGCGSVVGYQPTSNWVTSPIHDIQLITHFSTVKLYERRIKALNEVEFKDVAAKLLTDPKLQTLTLRGANELFKERKQMEVDSLQRTLDGDRNDSHRQGHDRCYAHIGDVKVHLLTEKVDGIKEPVVDSDGNVTVDSIMVPYLELNVTERQEGERKVVNSGNAVRMGNLIKSCLNKRSVVYKTLSLKADNFEAFRVDHQEFLPENVTKFGDILGS